MRLIAAWVALGLVCAAGDAFAQPVGQQLGPDGTTYWPPQLCENATHTALVYCDNTTSAVPNQGTPPTGVSAPSGATGVIGWLGAIWSRLGGTPTLAYANPSPVSVGITSGQLAAAGAFTRALQVCTLPGSTTNVWLNPAAGAAAVGAGIPVFAGGGCTSFGTPALPVPTAAINAITDGTAAQTVTLAGA